MEETKLGLLFILRPSVLMASHNVPHHQALPNRILSSLTQDMSIIMSVNVHSMHVYPWFVQSDFKPHHLLPNSFGFT